MKIANALSLLRLSLAPVSLLLFLEWEGATLTVIALMTLAGLTDCCDGYIARKRSETSRFGAYLDLIADHCYFSFSMVVLLHLNLLPLWLVVVVLLRTVVTSCVRGYNAYQLDIPHKTPVGVAATICMYVALPLAVVEWGLVTQISFVVSALLALWGLAEYSVFFVRKRGLR